MAATVSVICGVAYGVLVAWEGYPRDLYTYNGFTAWEGTE